MWKLGERVRGKKEQERKKETVDLHKEDTRLT